MAPRESSNTGLVRENGVLDEHDIKVDEPKKVPKLEKIKKAENTEYKWFNIIAMAVLHILAVYGVYIAVTGYAKWQTLIFGI